VLVLTRLHGSKYLPNFEYMKTMRKSEYMKTMQESNILLMVCTITFIQIK
jgi:hypothetical protein